MLRFKSFFSSIIFFGILLFFLRLPSLFFSWWYGDENIYLAIGHALVKGQLLYVQAWDNKPPLIYLIYAGIYTYFQTNMYAYKTVNLLFALWNVVIFYDILKNIFIFPYKQRFWSTLSMTILLGIGLEGTILNAENIFVPLVLSGFYVIYKQVIKFENTGKINSYKLIIGGIFWLLASLTKVHAVLEIVTLIFIIVVILIYNKLSRVKKWRNLLLQICQLKELRYFLLLPLLPIVLGYTCVILFYSFRGYLPELLYSIIGFGQDYVQSQNIPIILGFKLDKLTTGLQIRTVLLGISLVTYIYLYWKKYIERNIFIIWFWLSSTVFIVLIPERSYSHYLLQLLPPSLIFFTSFVSQLFLNRKPITEKLLPVITVGLGAQMLLVNFPTTLNSLWNYYDIVLKYFGNFVVVSFGKKSLGEWQKSYNQLLYEAQELLPSKIQELTTPEDKIFIYANLPEIYAISNRINAAKWVALYHIVDLKVEQEKLYKEIVLNKTKLIVIDSNMDTHKKFSNLISANYQKIISMQQYDFWIYK